MRRAILAAPRLADCKKPYVPSSARSSRAGPLTAPTQQGRGACTGLPTLQLPLPVLRDPPVGQAGGGGTGMVAVSGSGDRAGHPASRGAGGMGFPSGGRFPPCPGLCRTSMDY